MLHLSPHGKKGEYCDDYDDGNSKGIWINVAQGELQLCLAAIFATVRTAFSSSGGRPVEFCAVIDIDPAAGIDRIGLMTPGVTAGK